MAEALAALYVNAGPLITTFTPNPTCTSTIRDDNTGSFIFYGYNQESSSCFPSSFNLGFVLTTANYYSPGRCPFQYTPYTVHGPSSSNGELTTKTTNSDEHTFVCCPRDFTPQTLTQAGWDRGCASTISSSSVVTFFTQSDNATEPTALSTTITAGLPIPVFAYGIQVRFETADLPALKLGTDELSQYGLTTSGSSTVFIAQPTSIVTPTSTAPSITGTTQVNGNPTTREGLSSGAKIAIGLGVPLVCLLALVFVFIFLQCRSRARRRAYTYPPHLPAAETNNRQYYNPSEHAIMEADSLNTPIMEADSHNTPIKTSSSQEVSEIDGHSALPPYISGFDRPQELDGGTRHEVA